MKRLFVNFMTFAAMATALTFTACSSDSDGDDNGNGNGGNGGGTGSSIVVGENILSGTLTGEQTLDAKEYILNGTVIIADGGRLNIPAGTTIKAREGFSSYLLVAQGGKLLCRWYGRQTNRLYGKYHQPGIRILGWRDHQW